jgi:hypothetical protein
MLTKVLLAGLYDGVEAYDYINTNLIASTEVLATHYEVIMGNKIEYRVALNDLAITALITAANSAYVDPA